MKSGRGRKKIKVLQGPLVGVSLCLFTRNPVSFLGPGSLPASIVGLATALMVREVQSPSQTALVLLQPSTFPGPELSQRRGRLGLQEGAAPFPFLQETLSSPHCGRRPGCREEEGSPLSPGCIPTSCETLEKSAIFPGCGFCHPYSGGGLRVKPALADAHWGVSGE